MRKRLAAAFALVAAVVSVVVVVSVVWAFFLRGDFPEPPAPRPAQLELPEPVAPVTADPPASLPRDDLPEPVQRYLESTVYPPDSGRLDLAADLLEPNARYERFKPVPGSHGSVPEIEFRWTADAFRYTSDEVVHARFEARQGEAAAVVRDLDAWAQAEGRAGLERTPLRLVLHRDGDAWAAELDLSEAFEEHHGFVVLGIRYTVADVAQQSEQIRIFVTPASEIPGVFSGTFRERVSDGSLVVEAGVELYRDGFYRFDANLYDRAGKPLAWAVYKGELSRRDGSVPLRFFGKVLHDLGSAGPYEMRQLRGYLFLDGEFPDRIHLRDFDGTHVARGFSLEDLSEAEWDGEHRRQMVELLLQDEAAGISIDAPAPAAADSGTASEASSLDALEEPAGRTAQ